MKSEKEIVSKLNKVNRNLHKLRKFFSVRDDWYNLDYKEKKIEYYVLMKQKELLNWILETKIGKENEN